MQSTDSMADRVIGIADMAVSASSADRLVTYAGSCLGSACTIPRVAGCCT
jgi:hypothetical protein